MTTEAGAGWVLGGREELQVRGDTAADGSGETKAKDVLCINSGDRL